MSFANVETPETSPTELVEQAAAKRQGPDEGVALVGRNREAALIQELLERARAGESGSLVVRGEPGIGKSALLDRAVERADGMLVLSTAGVEAEADLAFAGLFGLVRPILDHLDDLPPVQAAALAGALGLGPSQSPERFLVSAAVLGLLAEAADRRPVLCLVDDAQWLDKPSADALVFAARRLRAERVALLFAARVGDVRTFEAPGLSDLSLRPLDEHDALSLLLSRGQPVAPTVRKRLLQAAAGNPLALLELPIGLSDAQRTGRELLPDPIPLSSRLQASFAARLETLPKPARALLLVAAADDTGDLAHVVRAGAAVGATLQALEPAEAAGLVHMTATRIAFRHPLVRAAVISAATLAQRQRTHAALADALDGEEHADRRVWHQALASLTADENVAAALEAAGRRTQLRGGHASAATAFERAAKLTDDPAARTRRLAAAAEAASEAGQPDRARALIERTLVRAEGSERAQLLYLSGVIEGRTGRLMDGVETLRRGIAAGDDPSLILKMLREASDFAAFAGEYEQVADLCARAADVPVSSDEDRFIATVLASITAELEDDFGRATVLCTEAIELAERLDDPVSLVWAATTAGRLGVWGEGLAYAERAVSIARERGLLTILPHALCAQAGQLLGRSEFDLAYAAAEEGRVLAVETEQPWAACWNIVTLAMIEALRGREKETRAHVAELRAFGQWSGARFVGGYIDRALGLLELALGRPDDALDRLLASFAASPYESGPLVVFGMPDVVEAAARSNRLDEVTDRLARYESWVERFPNPGRLALLARARAAAAGAGAEPLFLEAIERACALTPFGLGRTELLYGEWLRRERRRVEARAHLRAAVEAFEQLGVGGPWDERARMELRASGETARKRTSSTLAELTPRELQIARLAADGLTNREIGAQLFLSPRTIDYHLRKVFTKLRIASRTELARVSLGGSAPA
jgi:DNA-binding CsgD family transcriptional regulator